jgi:hypothetical protein
LQAAAGASKRHRPPVQRPRSGRRDACVGEPRPADNHRLEWVTARPSSALAPFRLARSSHRGLESFRGRNLCR